MPLMYSLLFIIVQLLHLKGMIVAHSTQCKKIQLYQINSLFFITT